VSTFAIKQADNRKICPVLGIKIHVKVHKLLSISVTRGFLFPSLSKDKHVAYSSLNSSAAQSQLEVYVKQLTHHFKDRKFLWHLLKLAFMKLWITLVGNLRQLNITSN